LIVLHAESHFSLLVYAKESQRLYHYNTLPAYHVRYAEEMAKALHAMEIIGNYDDLIRRPSFVPIQMNQWECGYSVFLFARIIVNKPAPRLLSREDIEERYPGLIDPKSCLMMRYKLREFFIDARERELQRELGTTREAGAENAKDNLQIEDDDILLPPISLSLSTQSSADFNSTSYMRIITNPFAPDSPSPIYSHP
jgi:hypothetical protein